MLSGLVKKISVLRSEVLAERERISRSELEWNPESYWAGVRTGVQRALDIVCLWGPEKELLLVDQLSPETKESVVLDFLGNVADKALLVNTDEKYQEDWFILSDEEQQVLVDEWSGVKKDQDDPALTAKVCMAQALYASVNCNAHEAFDLWRAITGSDNSDEFSELVNGGKS